MLEFYVWVLITDFNIQTGTLIGTLVIIDSLHNLLIILKLEKSGKTWEIKWDDQFFRDKNSITNSYSC